jgi:UDP-N-acetylmuramyl pentapeptide phosphotransferase/UDP-N-acetylglucosamine-1-phosphate transferase
MKSIVITTIKGLAITVPLALVVLLVLTKPIIAYCLFCVMLGVLSYLVGRIYEDCKKVPRRN